MDKEIIELCNLTLAQGTTQPYGADSPKMKTLATKILKRKECKTCGGDGEVSVFCGSHYMETQCPDCKES